MSYALTFLAGAVACAAFILRRAYKGSDIKGWASAIAGLFARKG